MPTPDQGASIIQQRAAAHGEAYRSLARRLGFDDGLPHDPKWSAAPDFLELIADHLLTYGPERIVECSSGATTLVLARCCQINGRGRVLSLENGARFADDTRTRIARHGLQAWARVLDAPLRSTPLGGVEYQWYDLRALPASGIDMLMIDGPPGFIQRHSRYPAIPRLLGRLSEDAVVFMDDAARTEEREIVDMWLARCPGLWHEYRALERGCSILRRGAGPVRRAGDCWQPGRGGRRGCLSNTGR